MEPNYDPPLTEDEIAQRLRRCGINPTRQRVEIAQTLFRRQAHYSAEEVFEEVGRAQGKVSKATVYNTLGLFVERQLIRQVFVDSAKVFYDSNTRPHHHFYDTERGELTDIDAGSVVVDGVPPLPAGTELAGVDVIVRLRRR